MMAPSDGFSPLIGADPRVLILGTLPGQQSLSERTYYAHPRNAFWPIVTSFLGFARDLPYESRVEAITSRGIAVWDVLKSASRPGSLDANIDKKSVCTNNFAQLLHNEPTLRTVLFNGASAERLYRQLVLPELQSLFDSIRYQRMPSTSPAYAKMPFVEKRDSWHEALRIALV